MTGSAIYEGVVGHVRHRPFHHRLRYGLFMLLIDLDDLDRLQAMSFFSHDRFALVSFHDRDHGPRDGTSLRSWITGEMRRFGIDGDPGRIRILCLPRILGYQFNPLTVWFIDDAEGRPSWVLYEIHNTFGEAHSHLAPVGGEHRFAKEFHVSPFLDVSGGYRVRISQPDDRLSIAIGYHDDGQRVLTATLTATRRPMTNGNLLQAVARHPLVTFKVMAAIHWHGARLWLKGARYRPKPPPPLDAVSAPTKMAP